MIERYKLIIDGEEIYTSNHIGVLKKHAAFQFEYCHACYAKITRGSKIYADKRWDTGWHRWA